MSSAALLRPKLHADVAFGPPQQRRGTRVFYVYDRRTAQAFVVRAHERFLLGAMDGQRSLEDIAHEYEQAFGARPGPGALEDLLRKLRQRQLLEDEAGVPAAVTTKGAAPAARARDTGRRWRLTESDAILREALPYARVLFTPAGVVAGTIAIVAAEIVVLRNIAPLAVAARAGGASVWLAFALLCLLSTILHELAHGLAALRFGGAVREFGVLLRYGVPHAYCRVEQVLLIPSRWQRVCVALAGPFASLLFMAPAAAVWTVWPHGAAGAVAARLLTLYNAGILLTFLPVLRLDGYWMLAYALDRPELRDDARLALREGRSRSTGGAGAERGRAERGLLISYALAEPLLGAALVGVGFVLAAWLVAAG